MFSNFQLLYLRAQIEFLSKLKLCVTFLPLYSVLQIQLLFRVIGVITNELHGTPKITHPNHPHMIIKHVFFRCSEISKFLHLRSWDILTKHDPKTYLQLEFEAYILQFRSTDEYFETAEYEVQTPPINIFLLYALSGGSENSKLAARIVMGFAL